FARYFARHGFAALIAHRWKMPREFELEAVDRWLRVSVEENQMVLDWAASRPELDAGRIGLFGISLGGIRGVLLTAIDPRIKASVLGLTGGDLPAILAHSADRGVKRRREEALGKTGWTLDEFETKLRESITCEPDVFAAHIDPHCVLLVLGVFDHMVPFKQGWELREHLGKPETILLPTGHLTAVLAIPMIQMQSVRFFEARMGFNPPASERKILRSPRDAGRR
ncbi:MAG TPA: alpha/beta hydrolase, partial [Candidatus Binatia bacterium]|nr:alpha/beta hydrolase [Candidatus Binatia bacterium]